jgi:pimeloyl-ACP methyl ester carboxylesterase
MTLIRNRRFAALVLFLALAAARPASGADLEDLAVVYLHGKGAWAGAFDGGLVNLLHKAGAMVATPELPWSFERIYDATYQDAMREIDGVVSQLKTQGQRTQVVVIGHSLGANAAIGYAASHGPVAAVVAIAPGHLPEIDDMRRLTHDARVEAARLVAAGQGDVPHAFPDAIQSVPTSVMATPLVYLSMFDPDGPAVIAKNAAAMPAVPVLWISGSFDRSAAPGRGYASALVAKHPKSRYVEVSAGHLSVGWAARTIIVDWLKSL